MPFMKREVRGRACAAWLKKRLSIFGCRKRERLAVGGLVAACGRSVRGCVKNRDEKISGIGGMSTAAPFTMREIRRRACATWLKKRLSFGRRKREPLIVWAEAAIQGRPWCVPRRAPARVL